MNLFCTTIIITGRNHSTCLFVVGVCGRRCVLRGFQLACGGADDDANCGSDGDDDGGGDDNGGGDDDDGGGDCDDGGHTI